MAKYKIIPSSRTIVQSPISIGHKAEKGVEAIEFDVTAWVETYGSGTLTVIMRRWGDAIPYPIALEIDENNKATWTLSDTDTAKAGMAYAQLNYIVGDEVVKKSDIYTFRVMDSLTGEGEPPEAYESWLEHLTHLAAEAMAEVLDIEGIVTDKTLTVDGGIADAKATGDALSALEDQFTEEADKLKADLDAVSEVLTVQYDLSGESTIKFNIGPSNGKWTRNENYASYYITVPASAKCVHIVANATNGTVYAMLASTDTPVQGNTPVYATGCTRTFLTAGKDVMLPIPSDCAYIWVTKTLSGTDYSPAFFGFSVDLSNVPKIPEIEENVDEMQGYLPHEVTLINKSGMASDKYVSDSTVAGDNWTNNLVNNTGSLYTVTALDVSAYVGQMLVIEIGSSDSHSGTRMFGFCNANNIVSSASKEAALSYSSEGGYLRARRKITNTHFFFSCSAKSHLRIYVIAQGILLDKVNNDTAYVTSDGNDDNPGSSVLPLATINKALENGARLICVNGGTYKQTIDLSKAVHNKISIVNATPTKKVVFMAPDCLITDTETAVEGYTKVYSAETDKSFHTNNIWIFQDGVADEYTEITAEERMPEQRGQAYRCYDTRILKASANTLADALTEIENATVYKWYKDGNILYFSRPEAVSSSNPICGSFATTLFSNNSRKNTLNVAGIDVKYMTFNINYTVNSHVVDCSVANVFGGGAYLMDGAVESEFIRCEACRAYSGTNGDGFNGHSSNTDDAFAHQTTATLIDCWSHDNRDDGISLHERSEFTVIGGLFEYNALGGGVTPANGSHCSCYNVFARNNGEGGFLYMNATSAAEGGVGGQIKCIDCISESNNTWAAVYSAGYKVNADGNKAILVGCKAINEDYGYYVETSQSVMEIVDCGAYNCTNIKGGQTAQITANNTTPVS